MMQPDIISNSAVPADAPVRHISKVLTAWLAFALGVFGAHWWYLGRPRAWLPTVFAVLMLAIAHSYPSWWDNPFFLVLIIPTAAGIIESLVFALKPDEQFDAKYNPSSGRTTHTGWDAVIVAIIATLMGGLVIIYGIAMIVMYVYSSMGWLDGYVI